MFILTNNLLLIALTLIGQLADNRLTLKTVAAEETTTPISTSTSTSTSTPTSSSTAVNNVMSQQQEQQLQEIHTTIIDTIGIATTTKTVPELLLQQQQQQQQQPSQEEKIDNHNENQNQNQNQLESSVIQMITKNYKKDDIHQNQDQNNNNNITMLLHNDIEIFSKNLNQVENHTNENPNKIEIQSEHNSPIEMESDTRNNKSTITQYKTITTTTEAATTLAAISDTTTTIIDDNNNNNNNQSKSEYDIDTNEKNFNVTKTTTNITEKTAVTTTQTLENMTSIIDSRQMLVDLTETKVSTEASTTTETKTPITIIKNHFDATTVTTSIKASPVPSIPSKIENFTDLPLKNINEFELAEMDSSGVESTTATTILETEGMTIRTTPSATIKSTNHDGNMNKRYNNNHDDDNDGHNYNKFTTEWPSNDYVTTVEAITTTEATIELTTKTDEIVTAATAATAASAVTATSPAVTTTTTITTLSPLTLAALTTLPTIATTNLNERIYNDANEDEIIIATRGAASEADAKTETVMQTETETTTPIQDEEFEITTTIAPSSQSLPQGKTTNKTNVILDNLNSNLFIAEENQQKVFETTTQNNERDMYTTTTEILDDLTTTYRVNLTESNESDINLDNITMNSTNRLSRILESSRIINNNIQIQEKVNQADFKTRGIGSVNTKEKEMNLSIPSIDIGEEYATTTESSITTENPDIDYLTTTTIITTTTIATPIMARPRNLPPSKLEHSRNSDGVEMFYGYSVVAHNQ